MARCRVRTRWAQSALRLSRPTHYRLVLWAYRDGDANMRSAWICTRNDVFGNLAVLLAAAGVFGTGTGWPDIIVATIMASLALQGAWLVVWQSLAELHQRLPIPAE
ncbi:MAG: cation transporter [Pseudolabrys sp.]